MLILYFISVFVAILSVLFLFINPVTGFSLVMLFKPVIDTGWYVSFGPGLTLTKLYGVMVPTIIICYMFFSSNPFRTISAMPIKGLWITYSIYITFFSFNMILSEGIVTGLDIFFSYINGIVGFYMMQAFVTNNDELKKLIYILIFAGLFPIFTTLYQVITGIEWHYLAHQKSESFTRSPGLYYLINTVRYYSYQTLIALLLYTTYIGKPVAWKKVAGWIYAAIIFVVLFKTYSKAGYAATALGAFVWLFMSRKYGALMAVSLLAMFMLPFYASEIVDSIYEVFHREVDAITGGEEGYNALGGRTAGWAKLMEEWARMSFFSQMFGTGVNMKGAHNDYIAMIWHGGVIGLMIYLTLLITIGVKLFVEIRKKVEPLLLSGVILYLVYLIDTIGLVPSTYPHFQWLVWGVIGLSLRRRQDERADVSTIANTEEQNIEEDIQSQRILHYKEN